MQTQAAGYALLSTISSGSTSLSGRIRPLNNVAPRSTSRSRPYLVEVLSVSQTGITFIAPAPFALGETVTVTFQGGLGQETLVQRVRVTRAFSDDSAYRVLVGQFVTPLTDAETNSVI